MQIVQEHIEKQDGLSLQEVLEKESIDEELYLKCLQSSSLRGN